jgi:hypothetical protein
VEIKDVSRCPIELGPRSRPLRHRHVIDTHGTAALLIHMPLSCRDMPTCHHVVLCLLSGHPLHPSSSPPPRAATTAVMSCLPKVSMSIFMESGGGPGGPCGTVHVRGPWAGSTCHNIHPTTLVRKDTVIARFGGKGDREK